MAQLFDHFLFFKILFNKIYQFTLVLQKQFLTAHLILLLTVN